MPCIRMRRRIHNEIGILVVFPINSLFKWYVLEQENYLQLIFARYLFCKTVDVYQYCTCNIAKISRPIKTQRVGYH